MLGKCSTPSAPNNTFDIWKEYEISIPNKPIAEMAKGLISWELHLPPFLEDYVKNGSETHLGSEERVLWCLP
jgi:hypothetical protein